MQHRRQSRLYSLRHLQYRNSALCFSVMFETDYFTKFGGVILYSEHLLKYSSTAQQHIVLPIYAPLNPSQSVKVARRVSFCVVKSRYIVIRARMKKAHRRR
jgi:hypothetical protein